MEEFKKGYAAAHTKFAAYEKDGKMKYERQGDTADLLGMALYMFAEVAVNALSVKALHEIADDLKGDFLRACIDITVETEGGGIFGNDHFTN